MKNIRTSAQDHNFRKVCTFTSVMHILTISLDLDLCLAGLKVLRYFHTLFVLVSSCLLLLYGCKFFLSFFFNDFCTCFMRDQYFHFSSVSYLWLHLNTIYCNYHLILFNLFGNYNHGNSKCLINYLKLFHISKLEIENLPQKFHFQKFRIFLFRKMELISIISNLGVTDGWFYNQLPSHEFNTWGVDCVSKFSKHKLTTAHKIS